MTPLADEELRRRGRAWEALSPLFLDTEIRDGLPSSAIALLDSGYRDIEIESIFLDEVTPILHWNLKQVAGEWAGFDADWLRDQIIARRRPGPTPRVLGRLARWVERVRAWPALHEFEVLLALVGRARAMEPEQRGPWALALGALAGIYFERPTMDGFLARHEAQLASVAPSVGAAQLRAWADRDLYPLFKILRVRGIDPPEELGRAQVEAALVRAGV